MTTKTSKPEREAFELVPPGLYNARLVEVQSDHSMCLFVFEITTGQYKGRKIFRSIGANDQTNVQIEVVHQTDPGIGNKKVTSLFIGRFTYGLPPAGK